MAFERAPIIHWLFCANNATLVDPLVDSEEGLMTRKNSHIIVWGVRTFSPPLSYLISSTTDDMMH